MNLFASARWKIGSFHIFSRYLRFNSSTIGCVIERRKSTVARILAQLIKRSITWFGSNSRSRQNIWTFFTAVGAHTQCCAHYVWGISKYGLENSIKTDHKILKFIFMSQFSAVHYFLFTRMYRGWTELIRPKLALKRSNVWLTLSCDTFDDAWGWEKAKNFLINKFSSSPFIPHLQWNQNNISQLYNL